MNTVQRIAKNTEAKGLWVQGVLNLKNLRFGKRVKTLLFTFIEYQTNSEDFAKDYGLRDVPKETFKEIEMGCIEMSSMLSKLIAARAKTVSP